MFYTNKNIPLVTRASIIEWDIKSANTSLMRYYNLYPLKKIEKIESMDKENRVIAVGKLMKNDKEFSKKLGSAFNDIIKEFISSNNIPEEDIISVKRDAVFVRNFDIEKTAFGDSVLFVPKNEYKTFMKLPLYEFYINDYKIDVKGIVNEKLELHKNGMLRFIRDIYSFNGERYDLSKYYLKDFVLAYKKKELEFDMYREFSSGSTYRLDIDGYELLIDNISEDDMAYLDISYNYMNVILPSIRLFI